MSDRWDWMLAALIALALGGVVWLTVVMAPSPMAIPSGQPPVGEAAR